MKRILLALLFLSSSVALGQWKKSGGVFVPNDTTLAVKVKTLTVESTANLPGHDTTKAFVVVPEGGYSHTTSTFAAALNDSIAIYGVYLPYAVALGDAAVGTGSLGGSCAVRGFGVAAYGSDGALIDTTSFTSWPGNGTGGAAAFVNNATVGPGFVYFAFSTYNDGTCTQTFRAPDLSTNTVFSGILASQNTSIPIVGYADSDLSGGAGWPTTITPVKATGTFLFPYIYIGGTALD